MKLVERSEILDYVTYSEKRDMVRTEMIQKKKARRVHVGDHLTFLFENTETIRYQIQEMVLVEKIVKEEDIQHEISTYNEVLGGKGELGCTLLIEVDDAVIRPVKLREWLELPKHLYAKLSDGSRVYATYDPRQVGEDRVSSVQFLKFDTGGQTPVAFGSDLPELTVEGNLNESQLEALEKDLELLD